MIFVIFVIFMMRNTRSYRLIYLKNHNNQMNHSLDYILIKSLFLYIQYKINHSKNKIKKP